MMLAMLPFFLCDQWIMVHYICAESFACVRVCLISELKSRQVQGRSWPDIAEGPGSVPGPDIEHVRGGQ
jgi:hypothetical protein